MKNIDLYKFDEQYNGIIAGVDEAGRGPWAGPVVVSAVILDKNKIHKLFEVNDSKKISEKKRERLFDIIVQVSLTYSIVELSNSIIDEKGILNTTLEGMREAVLKLQIKPDIVLIDGISKIQIEGYDIRCVKKGDSKSLSIASASILAKVYRDRIMRNYAEIYSEYGFKNNKGYGTPEHKKALKKYGVSPIHRLSYRPVKAVLNGK